MDLRTQEHAEHIWSMDPALDIEAEGFLDKWREAIAVGKVSTLPLKEGLRPGVWKLRPLKRRTILEIATLKRGEHNCELVAYGLVDVVGVSVNGRPLVLKTEKADGSDRLTRATLDSFYHTGLFEELGAAIIKLSHPDPTCGQGS